MSTDNRNPEIGSEITEVFGVFPDSQEKVREELNDNRTEVEKAAIDVVDGSEFKVGDIVRIRRSSGKMDGGWSLERELAPGQFVAVKEGEGGKVVTAEELEEWSTRFEVGENVTVRRSSGVLENGWIVILYEPAENEYLTMNSEGSRKRVRAQDLREWSKARN